MGFTWPQDADTQILLAIRRTCDIKWDYQKLADELSKTMDTEVTVTNIKNRLNNTLARAKSSSGTPTKRTKPAKSDATSTPKKEKATPKPKSLSKSTPSKRKAAKVGENEDSDGRDANEKEEEAEDDPFGVLSEIKDDDDEEMNLPDFWVKRRRHLNHDDEDEA